MYVVARSKARAAGVAMASATHIVTAFHSLGLYSLHDVAAAVGQTLGESKRAEGKTAAPESKGDAKAAVPSADSIAGAREAIAEKVCSSPPVSPLI